MLRDDVSTKRTVSDELKGLGVIELVIDLSFQKLKMTAIRNRSSKLKCEINYRLKDSNLKGIKNKTIPNCKK